jgi:hypothetical protein
MLSSSLRLRGILSDQGTWTFKLATGSNQHGLQTITRFECRIYINVSTVQMVRLTTLHWFSKSRKDLDMGTPQEHSRGAFYLLSGSSIASLTCVNGIEVVGARRIHNVSYMYTSSERMSASSQGLSHRTKP